MVEGLKLHQSDTIHRLLLLNLTKTTIKYQAKGGREKVK